VPLWTIFAVALGYMGLLFAIAYYGDQRSERGRSIISNPYVYALSMAVYCTAWTFYGSVGRAATDGLGFLPIYIGPTLMAALWWFVLRKMIRISKVNRITSIADFIASRYGKSMALGGLVTVLAVVGGVPYISLQLRAVSTSFTLLWEHLQPPAAGAAPPLPLHDTALYAALVLAAFAILFGTRHLDVTEHHEGLVAAIAFESVVKLVAFLSVGVFVTWGLFHGVGDLFTRAAATPELRPLLTVGGAAQGGVSYASWATLTLLSMMAILFLPRQYQMSVVENVDERYLNKAIWLFPLYLLVMNVFVMPIALAGRLRFPGGGVDSDTFVLTLPLAAHHDLLALLVFVGGLSAATSMVIVASVALSTMVSNDLVLPLLLRLRALALTGRRRPGDLSRLTLTIRRLAIVSILVLGYLYHRQLAPSVPLVSIGLISFAAAAQFAPAILGGLYWKGGTRLGALTGLAAGSAVWAYTLPLPSLVTSGWLPESFLRDGPGGIALLRPYQLLGLVGLDPISHSLFWSLLANGAGYLGVSLLGRQSAIEYSQGVLFVDIFKHSSATTVPPLWRGTASVEALRTLLQRFLSAGRANAALNAYARSRGIDWSRRPDADAELVEHTEKLLSGAIGAASARVAVASVVQEEPLAPRQVLRMLEETSQLVAYSRQLELRSRQLEAKSAELEAATRELRRANERLQEVDRLKDDFLSTVTHELRTPLTSIRAFSEILHQNPDLETAQRGEFVGIVLKETERLTRLINQVLDLAKIESGAMDWNPAQVDLRELVAEATRSMSQLFADREVALEVSLPERVPAVRVDRDRILQVLLNLLSNAHKFCPAEGGWVGVAVYAGASWVEVAVSDNGPGLSAEAREVVFEKFRQLGDRLSGQRQGSGLGLPISRHIVTHFGGRLWVEDGGASGARFAFRLPFDRLSAGRRPPVDAALAGQETTP
jgi:Na+/proline symporter/nitrogen-specific signal transduction histidine kinase